MMSSNVSPRVRRSEPYVIRRLQNDKHEELTAIVSLINKCYRTTKNWTNEAHILCGMRITSCQLLEEAKLNDIFVIEETKSKLLVGCVKTGVVTETVVGPLPEPTGYIGLLAVSSCFQSRGLGNMLINYAEQHCKFLGVHIMSLNVLSIREELISWYERHGYKKIGNAIDSVPFFKEKGETLLMPTDFILLQKPLTP